MSAYHSRLWPLWVGRVSRAEPTDIRCCRYSGRREKGRSRPTGFIQERCESIAKAVSCAEHETTPQGILCLGFLRRRGDSVMERRTFVNLVAGSCLLGPLAVRAQQAGK